MIRRLTHQPFGTVRIMNGIMNLSGDIPIRQLKSHRNPTYRK